jgi:hypothetical protein
MYRSPLQMGRGEARDQSTIRKRIACKRQKQKRRLITTGLAARKAAPMTAQQLNQHLRHLGEANLFIVQTRARIERQRLLLATLDAGGRKAKYSLTRSETTLQGMLQGRALILEDLNRSAIGFHEPEGLRGRAREARAIADDITARAGKRLMLRVAKSYDRLAKLAEHRPVRRSPRSDCGFSD